MTEPPAVPPAEPPGQAPVSLGLDPKIAAALAYLFGWVTGALVLLLERDNRFVRFHAMQSVVGLGGLWALSLFFWLSGFLSMFVSPAWFSPMLALGQIASIAGVIAWLICLFKAYTGEWWKLPIAGGVAERLLEGR